ncbi:hypothetical protein BDR07DRAFT_1435084 [Suillus spraguei]|nr:hypothetical protein BDR07DRAFT_1435084 [Suillus spraguei]
MLVMVPNATMRLMLCILDAVYNGPRQLHARRLVMRRISTNRSDAIRVVSKEHCISSCLSLEATSPASQRHHQIFHPHIRGTLRKILEAIEPTVGSCSNAIPCAPVNSVPCMMA